MKVSNRGKKAVVYPAAYAFLADNTKADEKIGFDAYAILRKMPGLNPLTIQAVVKKMERETGDRIENVQPHVWQWRFVPREAAE